MRHARFLFGLMAGSLLIAGCMRPFFSSSDARSGATNAPAAQYTSAVAVRFFVPPDAQEFAEFSGDPNAQLVADSDYQGTVDADNDGIPDTPGPSPVHVALWGGPFYGHETTYALTALTPGDYMFALVNQDEQDAVQGWIHVNHAGDDLSDTLQRWKAEIPKMKQWLAYDFELQGKLNTGDAQVFDSFTRQLRAVERLERELDQAIQHELRGQKSSRQRNATFLDEAEVLLFPSDPDFFRPTTKAAFTVADFDEVKKGEARSKMVLVADYPTAQWKLRLVNQLTGELGRCKSVFVEEADRLARRKRYYALTDHIYNHDRKFVENEMRLQQCMASIDRLNNQMSELRERRMALAFITGLFAPDSSMEALNQQEQDLIRERNVLQTQRERFDKLFTETDEDSARRVVFERSRQETNHAIDDVNTQIERVAEARTALTKLRENTDVIYRQGDQSMIASSFFSKDIPFPFRQTVEHESLMSIRVEPADEEQVPAILAHMAALRAGMDPTQYAANYAPIPPSQGQYSSTSGMYSHPQHGATPSAPASAKWSTKQTPSSASSQPSKSGSYGQTPSQQTGKTQTVESTSTFVTKHGSKSDTHPSDANDKFAEGTTSDRSMPSQHDTVGQAGAPDGSADSQTTHPMDTVQQAEGEPQPAWQQQPSEDEPAGSENAQFAQQNADQQDVDHPSPSHGQPSEQPEPQPAWQPQQQQQAQGQPSEQPAGQQQAQGQPEPSQQTQFAQQNADQHDVDQQSPSYGQPSQQPEPQPAWQPQQQQAQGQPANQPGGQQQAEGQPSKHSGWQQQPAQGQSQPSQQTQFAQQKDRDQGAQQPSASQGSFGTKPNDMKAVDQPSSDSSYAQSSTKSQPGVKPNPQVHTEMQSTSTHSVHTTTSRRTQVAGTTPGQQDQSYVSSNENQQNEKYQQTRYETYNTKSTKVKQTSDRAQQNQKKAQKGDDCPWYVKVLVPPCWFIEKDNG